MADCKNCDNLREHLRIAGKEMEELRKANEEFKTALAHVVYRSHDESDGCDGCIRARRLVEG